MSNILLINPHTPKFVKRRDKYIPHGLLYLASTLQRDGHQVQIIDANNDLLNLQQEKRESCIEYYYSQKFISKLNAFKPDLVGIGGLFSGCFKASIFISRIIKKHYPDIPIVLGGIHPTMFPKEILKDYLYIDYIILGEGEVSFSKLIKSHFNDKKIIKDIGGIAFRENGKVTINPRTKFNDNLDDLPFPAYDLLNLKEYYMDTAHWHNPKNLPINIPLPIISSRSCPYHCTFCSVFLMQGRGYRPRSPKNVVDEIEYLYKEYNHRYFSFMDDNFTLSKKRTLDICNEIINRRLNIQFDTPNGISIKTLDKEVIDVLIQAGLIRTCIAIESGSEFIRNQVIQKGLPTQTIYDFFEMVEDYKDLHIKVFFIIGYPQETKETLKETYEMIKRIPIEQVGIFFLALYPGTTIFKYCQDNNLISYSPNNLHNIDTLYYYENDAPLIKPYQLKIEDLIEFRKKAYDFINQRRAKLCLNPIEY